MNKNEIRELIKKTRRELSKEDVNLKSSLITKRFIESDLYKNANVIMLYSPIYNEVDTEKLINTCFEDSKTVLLPVTENDIITPVLTDKNEQYEKGAYNINEPQSKKIYNKKSADIVIVPGIAFDKKGTRIGFGKGCYDKFLNNFNAVKIGFSYDFQIVEQIEKSEFDIEMNYIITESEMIICE